MNYHVWYRNIFRYIQWRRNWINAYWRYMYFCSKYKHLEAIVPSIIFDTDEMIIFSCQLLLWLFMSLLNNFNSGFFVEWIIFIDTHRYSSDNMSMFEVKRVTEFFLNAWSNVKKNRSNDPSDWSIFGLKWHKRYHLKFLKHLLVL